MNDDDDDDFIEKRLNRFSVALWWASRERSPLKWRPTTYFEIAVHNTLRVHVVDGFEYLLNEIRRVLFRVAALFHDPIEEFAAVDARGRSRVRLGSILLKFSF